MASEVTQLRIANSFPASHKNSKLLEAWCIEIMEQTGGRANIRLFSGGTLARPEQTFDSVVKGIADIGISAFAYSKGKFPLMEVIDLPLGYKSAAQATELINAFYAKFQPEKLARVKVLYLHASGPYVLHSKTPIATLDAFKGKKIIATGLQAKIVTALGGLPVSPTMLDPYNLLRTGEAEGVMGSMATLKISKWGEVVSSTTLNYGSTFSYGFFVVMNKQKWDALPADIQKIFMEVSAEYAVKHVKIWDELDTEGLEFAKTKNLKTTTLTNEEDAKWAEKVKPLLDEYVTNSKAKGLPGEEALKFCQDFLKNQEILANSVRDFVRRFYEVVLGRAAEDAGLDYWTNSLIDGTRAGADVAWGFIFSQEFMNQQLDNTSYLNVLYSAFFNRPPDSGGHSYWLGKLNTGETRQNVLNGFIYSQEFFNLCLAYSISAVK